MRLSGGHPRTPQQPRSEWTAGAEAAVAAQSIGMEELDELRASRRREQGDVARVVPYVLSGPSAVQHDPKKNHGGNDSGSQWSHGPQASRQSW